MTRRAWTSIFTAAAITIAVPLAAQEKGARPNSGSGGGGGSAVSRPSGGSGGGGTSSGGGSSMSSPSGGSGSGGSSVSRPSGSGGGDEGYRAAPARPERRTGAAAVPRGNNGESSRRVSPGQGVNASADGDNGDRRRAVPVHSRPRDGRPAVGSATGRTRPPYSSGAYGNYYDPFNRYGYYFSRYPYGYYYPSYGFGVGYFYDPWMWGYYSPYGYGGYYDPYAGGGYYGGGGGYGYGGTYSRQRYRDTGSLRLKVQPRQGQVYVDGYYVGEVDSFDGVFQRLSLEAGAHRIEIRAEGFETAQFEVLIVAGETVTYKGELVRR